MGLLYPACAPCLFIVYKKGAIYMERWSPWHPCDTAVFRHWFIGLLGGAGEREKGGKKVKLEGLD